jgi:hypothetical protein
MKSLFRFTICRRKHDVQRRHALHRQAAKSIVKPKPCNFFAAAVEDVLLQQIMAAAACAVAHEGDNVTPREGTEKGEA